jgi:hypothetical protein
MIDCSMRKSVLRIRIRMFLGLLDPDPDPLVKGMDPITASVQQKSKKNRYLFFFCFFLLLFDFLHIFEK